MDGVPLLASRAVLSWPKAPIPHFALSAAGLLALADLSTIAKRTALKGSASWLDVLMLAPGMHNQQLADVLCTSAPLAAQSLQTGQIYRLANQATIQYLRRVSRPGQTVLLQVHPRHRRDGRAGVETAVDSHSSLMGALVNQVAAPDADLLSALLYLVGPALTVTALILLGLTGDWWGLGLIFMMMLSRALNIWIIQQRLSAEEEEDELEDRAEAVEKKDGLLPMRHRSTRSSPREMSEFMVQLGPDRVVLIRGYLNDLKAISGAWLRDKTNVEGYLEAFAKLLVYLTAVFSGNVFQTGNIIIIVLLIVSSAALALSNSHTKSLQMHGRTASVTSLLQAATAPTPAAGLRVEMADSPSQDFGPPKRTDTGYTSGNDSGYGNISGELRGDFGNDPNQHDGNWKDFVQNSFNSGTDDRWAESLPPLGSPDVSPTTERQAMLRRQRYERQDTDETWMTPQPPPPMRRLDEQAGRYRRSPSIPRSSEEHGNRRSYPPSAGPSHMRWDSRRRLPHLPMESTSTLGEEGFEQRHAGHGHIDKGFPFADDMDYV